MEGGWKRKGARRRGRMSDKQTRRMEERRRRNNRVRRIECAEI